MKLALIAPSYAALPGSDSAGTVRLLQWEGTARDLRLVSVETYEGPLEQALAQWGPVLQSRERVVCVVPESLMYWFEPQVPFAQRRKLEAVLGSVLEDEWPGELENAEYRFDVTQAAGEIRARACMSERRPLTAMEDLFVAAAIPLDGLVPAGVVAARLARPGAALGLYSDEHLTMRVLTADGPFWSTVRLPPDADILQEFELAQERASRMQSVDDGGAGMAPILLSLDAPIAVPENYARAEPPTTVRAQCQTDLDVALWGTLALEVLRSSPYLFGSRRRSQNPLAALPRTVSPRLLLAAVVAGLCLALGSWFSLWAKRAEAETYKQTAEAVFARAFPGQSPGGNVAKQARSLMGGGQAPGSEHARNPSLIAIMEHIQRAMPVGNAATIEKIDIVGQVWNLAGQCADFGCVDALKAGLEKAPQVGEVKVNSAKQGVNKDKIKFSLTVKGTGGEKGTSAE